MIKTVKIRLPSEELVNVPSEPGLYWITAQGDLPGIAKVEGKAPYLRISAVWLINAIDFDGKPYLITDAVEIQQVIGSWGAEVK